VKNQTNRYLKALNRSRFAGLIESSETQKFASSTDNSIFQIVPSAILYPKNSVDIKIALKLGSKYSNLHFTARGGSTATNGQSLNDSIIIDCSRFLRQITKLNLKEKWVEVEPGVRLSELNDYLQPHGYHFAPHISPDDRATIGGMIATDASGKGSFVFGKTSDHLIEAETLLANGQRYLFKTHELSKTKDKKIRQISDLVKNNITEINKKFPDVTRFPTGYNLSKLLSGNKINLTYLLAGSEGTLAITTKARLKITPINKFRSLIVNHYKNFNDALKDVTTLIKYSPFAIETMDEEILKLSKGYPLFQEIKEYIGAAKNINILEFQATTKKGLEKQTNKFLNDHKGSCLCSDENDIRKLWELRSLGVGIAGSMPGSRKPIPFIEDTVVDINKIHLYARDLKKILDSYKLKYVIYGHLDVGCLHVRPALDLTKEKDKKIKSEIISKTIKLVEKYNGVLWGEHGGGLKAPYIPEIYGANIYEIFVTIKELFDREYRLNPGKIVVRGDSVIVEEILNQVQDDTVGVRDDTVGVRDDSGLLQADYNKEIDEKLAADFEKVISCNGNTKCLSVDKNQVMCPSEKVTGEKIHSPKGRANLLRKWLHHISGNKPLDNRQIEEIKSSLDACLGCKACLSTCPVSVDIPTSKSYFLNWYYDNIGKRKIRDLFFARSEEMLAYYGKHPLAYNLLLRNPISKIVIRLMGIAESPKFYNSYYKILNQVQNDAVAKCHPELDSGSMSKISNVSWSVASGSKPVYLVTDAFTNFAEQHLLEDTITLLKKLGYEPKILPYFISGKAYFAEGAIERFEDIAQKNIKDLNEIAKQNIPIISIEPSINLFFRQEYKECFGKEIKFEIQLVEEFLVKNIDSYTHTHNDNMDIYYLLPHCTEKTSLPLNSKNWQKIFDKFGLNLEILPSGCCGMAGSYGYKTEFQKNSKALFELSWKQHFNNHQASQILATGYSCRSQSKKLTKQEIKHPIELLKRRLLITTP